MSAPSSSISLKPIKSYRQIAEEMLYLLTFVYSDPSQKYPIRKAVLEEVKSVTLALLYKVKDDKSLDISTVVKMVGMDVRSIEECIRKTCDEKKVVPVLRDTLAAILVMESVVMFEDFAI